MTHEPKQGEGAQRPHDPDAIEFPLEDHLDLHAFRPREILEAVEEYLQLAADRGLREVRLIHGKGIGFQRDRIRRLLEDHPLVEKFGDAPPGRGHWGSTIVRFKDEDAAR